MATRIGRVMGVVGYLATVVYAYFVIGYPSGFQLTRTMTHLQLFVVGFLVALLIRSFWALIFVPAIIIFTALLTGIISGPIVSFQEALADAFRFEVFLFGASFAGVFLGTLLPRIIRRVVRSALAEPPPAPPPAEPHPNGRDTSGI